MFMQKIEAPRVTCDLFGVQAGFYGNGGHAVDSGKGPRTANEAEAKAYADFIRRKNDLPEIGKPDLKHKGGYTGRGRSCPFIYVGATYGQHLGRGEYEAGAFSVLFPGANQTRATVTMETLGDAGEVLTSSTMPLEPKKGGIVWGKDEVRKACGPVAKVKAARTPTVGKARKAPTVDKRRAAIMLALSLRAKLRRERAISRDRFQHIIDLTSDLHGVGAESREVCAAPATPTHAAQNVPDAILSDLAAAERMMSGADYVAPKPRKVRALGHERAILRAWSMRKARRVAEFEAAEWEEAQHRAWSAGVGHKMARRRAVMRAMNLRAMLRDEKAMSDARLAEALRNADRARLAEQIAEDHLRMREQMRAALCAAERRAEAAEAENAELWAEIEKLTAPAIPAVQGPITAEAGA